MAIGGGGFTHESHPELDRFCLEQTPRSAPRIGFVGAADNDEPTAAASDEPAAPAVDADAATDVAEAPAEEVANAAPAANPNLLELTFNEQSWTEIFDANNQRVFVGLQTPGTTASVEGEPPFRLTVGNATGVELRYQGELVNLAERAGTNNVARFTLGE